MSSNPRRQWIHFGLLYAALTLFFGWYATIQLRRYPVGTAQAAAIYICLLLLFGLYLAPGFAVSRSWLAARLHGAPGVICCVLIFMIPYLIYCWGTGDFRWYAFAKLFALSALPFGLPVIAPVGSRRGLNWQDALILLCLILPVLFGQMAGIWNVPANLDFMARLFLVGIGSWSFLILRGLDESGYEFRISRATLHDVLISLAGFTVIALPLGLTLRFTAWNPQWRGLGTFIFDYFTIFLFVAVAEELFFRGVLQNLLEGSLHSRHAAQASASVLFGLSHILHAPFPNWRYVTLATVAGWFYGSAYRRHRSLMASSATHALVDTIWRTWFTRG
jgi:membrane protease YdiL (CAAX protease family)